MKYLMIVRVSVWRKCLKLKIKDILRVNGVLIALSGAIDK